MDEMVRIPVVIYRGGTSKAIFIKEKDLPSNPRIRDQVVCALFGSPDKRQIDGLGGADPLTSKLAIIGPPSRPGADIDYLFGQVHILEEFVEYAAVCGNISAAVGPYAIDEGLVRGNEPVTKVRIHNVNIDRMIEAHVHVENNKVKVNGDFSIDGVPGTGSRIDLNWVDTIGARTGKLLPTGNHQDIFYVPGYGNFTVSVVDVGNPGIFIKATDLGLEGTEKPQDIDHDEELLRKCNAISDEVSKILNTKARLTYVAKPQKYINFVSGHAVEEQEVDVLVRMIFMGKMHKAYAAAQTICCGAALCISGTVVNEVARKNFQSGALVRLGHPSGVAEIEIKVNSDAEKLEFASLIIPKTARRLMEGYAFVKADKFR